MSVDPVRDFAEERANEEAIRFGKGIEGRGHVVVRGAVLMREVRVNTPRGPADLTPQEARGLAVELVRRADNIDPAGSFVLSVWKTMHGAPKTPGQRVTDPRAFVEILGRDDCGRVAVIAWAPAAEQWLRSDGGTFYPVAWTEIPR